MLSTACVNQPAIPNLNVLAGIAETQQIKAKSMLKLTVGTSSHTFQFETQQDLDSAVDAFNKVNTCLYTNYQALTNVRQQLYAKL
jgi:hypothetical protein